MPIQIKYDTNPLLTALAAFVAGQGGAYRDVYLTETDRSLAQQRMNLAAMETPQRMMAERILSQANWQDRAEYARRMQQLEAENFPQQLAQEQERQRMMANLQAEITRQQWPEQLSRTLEEAEAVGQLKEEMQREAFARNVRQESALRDEQWQNNWDRYMRDDTLHALLDTMGPDARSQFEGQLIGQRYGMTGGQIPIQQGQRITPEMWQQSAQNAIPVQGTNDVMVVQPDGKVAYRTRGTPEEPPRQPAFPARNLHELVGGDPMEALKAYNMIASSVPKTKTQIVSGGVEGDKTVTVQLTPQEYRTAVKEAVDAYLQDQQEAAAAAMPTWVGAPGSGAGGVLPGMVGPPVPAPSKVTEKEVTEYARRLSAATPEDRLESANAAIDALIWKYIEPDGTIRKDWNANDERIIGAIVDALKKKYGDKPATAWDPADVRLRETLAYLRSRMR